MRSARAARSSSLDSKVWSKPDPRPRLGVFLWYDDGMRALLLIAALSLQAGAQPPKMDRADKVLMVADASLRAFDVFSTHWMLTAPCRCNRELNLPDAISHHTPVMAGYSAGVFAVNVLVARELERRGHRKLAKIPYLIDFYDDRQAVTNMWLRH